MSLEFETLLNEIEAIDGCPRTKRRVVAVLKSFVGQRVYFAQREAVGVDRAKAVAKMIEGGLTGIALTNAVAERFGVSAPSAYVLIKKARQWIERRDRG